MPVPRQEVLKSQGNLCCEPNLCLPPQTTPTLRQNPGKRQAEGKAQSSMRPRSFSPTRGQGLEPDGPTAAPSAHNACIPAACQRRLLSARLPSASRRSRETLPAMPTRGRCRPALVSRFPATEPALRCPRHRPPLTRIFGPAGSLQAGLGASAAISRDSPAPTSVGHPGEMPGGVTPVRAARWR